MRRRAPEPAQIADVFARYANFTLGGGSATVAQSCIAKFSINDAGSARTISHSALRLPKLTPGTNLLAFCTGIGWRSSGACPARSWLSWRRRSPAQAIVVFATTLFSHWQENPWAQAALHGAIAAAVAISRRAAAAVAITVKTCWTIAHPHFKGRARLRVVLIATAAFLLYVWLALPAVEVLLLAAVVGAFLLLP